MLLTKLSALGFIGLKLRAMLLNLWLHSRLSRRPTVASRNDPLSNPPSRGLQGIKSQAIVSAGETTSSSIVRASD
jgi:hypothetical protein